MTETTTVKLSRSDWDSLLTLLAGIREEEQKNGNDEVASAIDGLRERIKEQVSE
jgi:hypothetical protein